MTIWPTVYQEGYIFGLKIMGWNCSFLETSLAKHLIQGIVQDWFKTQDFLNETFS